MQPLPRPSPLHSFASMPTVRRSPSTVEMVRAIWSWLRGHALTTRERMTEARKIDEIAEELDSLDEKSVDSNPSPATPRRRESR
jgi:hypothetical protein